MLALRTGPSFRERRSEAYELTAYRAGLSLRTSTPHTLCQLPAIEENSLCRYYAAATVCCYLTYCIDTIVVVTTREYCCRVITETIEGAGDQTKFLRATIFVTLNEMLLIKIRNCSGGVVKIGMLEQQHDIWATGTVFRRVWVLNDHRGGDYGIARFSTLIEIVAHINCRSRLVRRIGRHDRCAFIC